MNTQELFSILAVIVTLRCIRSQIIIEKAMQDTAENYFPPYQPFEFAYQSNDGLGTTQHRSETGDTTGTVKGAYGYADPQGIYRTVEYVADTNGFHAVVKSNEPGTANQNTANAVFVVQPPPEGVSTETARKLSSAATQIIASPSSTIPIAVQSNVPRTYFSTYPIAVRPSAVSYPYPRYRTPSIPAISNPLHFGVRGNPFTPRGRAPKLIPAI